MATNKPRITLTLEPRQYEVLRSISDSSGQSMSGIVADLIEASQPILERMAVTFQKLKQVKEVERSSLLQAMDDAQAAFEPMAQEVIGQFDLFMERVEKAGVGTRVGAPATARVPTPAHLRTPSTNRGVTPTITKPRKPARGAASKQILTSKVLKKTSGKKRGVKP